MTMKKLFPTYITAYDFNQESYDEFIKTPNDGSQLDEYSNLILSSNSDDLDIVEVDKFLIKVTPRKNMFDQVQVENFFDTRVSEFTDTESDPENTSTDEELVVEFADEIEDELGDQLAQEQILQSQIDELSDTLDTEIERGVKFQENASENFSASKDLIISQRISLGQGTTDTDFSEKFPFLPKSEDEVEETADSFPFMSGS
jgi:hypothetical protein